MRGFKEGLTDELCSRYCETHNIQRIEDNGQRNLVDLPDWFFNYPTWINYFLFGNGARGLHPG